MNGWPLRLQGKDTKPTKKLYTVFLICRLLALARFYLRRHTLSMAIAKQDDNNCTPFEIANALKKVNISLKQKNFVYANYSISSLDCLK